MATSDSSCHYFFHQSSITIFYSFFSMQNNESKALNLSLIHVWALSMYAVAYSPKTEEDLQASPGMKQFIEGNEEGFRTTVDQLTEMGLMDEKGVTPYGFKFVLNARSATPNFKRLAANNFDAALRMFFVAVEALKERFGTNQIVPGAKGSDLADNMSDLAEYLMEITSEHRANRATAQTEVAPKKAAKKA